jgi:regulatory protein
MSICFFWLPRDEYLAKQSGIIMLFGEEEKILARLKRFCAYRERCCFEVQQKLQLLKVPRDIVNRFLQTLQNEGFINEERYARLFAGGYFRQKKWGKRKIVAALRQKGIAEADIRRGLQEINTTEYMQALNRLTEKTWKQFTREDKNKRIIKVRASLMRKGFEPELVSRAVTQLATSVK